MSNTSNATEVDVSGFKGVVASSKAYYRAAFRPTDNSSVTFFRIVFGFMMSAWAWDYLQSGRVTELYATPEFHFSYYGFGWVTADPPWGIYIHFLLIAAAAIGVATGWMYRFSATALALLFTYFFLIERTNYQNHYYLLALFCWWLPFLPLHRNVSCDAATGRVEKSQTTPAIVLWILQFHVFVPYFFGGVAKLTTDWLLGQPLGVMLSRLGEFPVVGPWLVWEPTAMLFGYFALCFDLGIVPALLWRKTRLIAYCLALVFHLGNSIFFSIHVFPWFMIVATTLFFEPDWVRRVIGGKAIETAKQWSVPKSSLAKLAALCVIGYCLFHCVWPLRHNLYAGETSWNERGHVFAWRMMLRGKEVGIGYALRDPENGQVVNVDHKQFVASEQAEKFPRDPEMILHMAHFIAGKFEVETGRRPEVYAFALASLNGRKPEFLVDPNQDLAAVPRGIYYEREWVPPVTEPLRWPAWDIPVQQWREHVEMPEIKFLEDMKKQSSTGASQ